MKRLIICILFICACIPMHAQINLLRNGSFEVHDSCPNDYDQIRYAKFWDGLDTNYTLFTTYIDTFGNFLPEYIQTCATSGTCSAPNNGHFYHYPRTGNGMAMSVMYYDLAYTYTSGLDDVNYIQGRMSGNLIAGKSYCVTFFVTQARASTYSINKIGAYLDDGTIDTTSRPGIVQPQYTPQILESSVIYDTTSWIKIQGNFIANGTEKFITIGVFFDTAHLTHIYNAYVGGGHDALYLVDDVSVIASDAVAYAGHDTTSMHNGDTVRLGAAENGDGMPCWWYKLGVTAPIDSGGTIYVHPDSSTSYVVMMDLCGHITYDTVKVWVYPDTPSHVGIEQLGIKNVQLYPNPATAKVTVENAANCEVVFYDVVGRIALRSSIISDKEQLDISQIANGIYMLHVIDSATGEKIVRKIMKE